MNLTGARNHFRSQRFCCQQTEPSACPNGVDAQAGSLPQALWQIASRLCPFHSAQAPSGCAVGRDSKPFPLLGTPHTQLNSSQAENNPVAFTSQPEPLPMLRFLPAYSWTSPTYLPWEVVTAGRGQDLCI